MPTLQLSHTSCDSSFFDNKQANIKSKNKKKSGKRKTKEENVKTLSIDFA